MTETDGGNPNDPSGFVTSPPQTLVKVIGTAREDINGKVGVVISYSRDRARYNVSILPGQSSSSSAGAAAAARASGSTGGGGQQVLSFKAENLVQASAVEKIKSQAMVALDRLKRMVNDPEVREQARRAYTSVQARLPAGVKPEYVGAALLVLYWLCIWKFGFAKVFMATSLSGLVVSVILPDVLAGADAQTIQRNFPRRLRESVVQATGFTRITEKQALGAFVVVMLLSGKVLLTPTPKRAPKTPAAPAATRPDPPGYSRGLNVPKFDVEEIYKLGFDDAKEGRDFGTSMPDPAEVSAEEEAAAAASARGVSPNADPREWDLNPPPRQDGGGSGSKFGFGTIMSAFTLFRFGKEIAINPDGRFDQQMAMANLSVIPPWKLAIVAFCLYRVVSVVF